jgi:hypothetical protein
MSFVLADSPHGQVPRILEKPLASGASFPQGSLVLLNGSGQWAECGADPVSIGGVAATPAGNNSTGFGWNAKQEFPPGYLQVITLNQDVRFRAKYTGTLPAADGGSYGVVKDGTTGLWLVDFSDTVATRVKLVGRLTNSPENIAQVIVMFLAANIQPL